MTRIKFVCPKYEGINDESATAYILATDVLVCEQVLHCEKCKLSIRAKHLYNANANFCHGPIDLGTWSEV